MPDRTFFDQLADDGNQCFLNTGEFGQEIEHWPAGDRLQAQTVVAIWDADSEQGENAGLLHKMTDDRGGRSQHDYIAVELLKTVRVHHNDRFRYECPQSGEVSIGQAVRRIASDGAMQTWLVTVTKGIDSKHARVRP